MIMDKVQHVFIIGSKGIPAHYGGFETFVEKLTKYNNHQIKYHVSCISDTSGSFIYNDAICVNIKVPNLGSAKAIFYDCASLRYFIQYCKEHPEIKNMIFYVLACRIGPFIKHYRKQIERLGGKLYINPDGQEWKRRKWIRPIRWYWKYSEGVMVKNADSVICDSKETLNYIKERYKKYGSNASYIAYGAEKPETCNDNKLEEWLQKRNIKRQEYYLLVGRFVPENNFDIIIGEFMASSTTKKLVIITGNNGRLKKKTCKKTRCNTDSRVIFAGTVYDYDLLCAIRENAYGSFHGHEVGGTNPSLLEAMICSKINILLDVVFNREVGGDAALYWKKTKGSLKQVIEDVETMSEKVRLDWGIKSYQRMITEYSWNKIESDYRKVFTTGERLNEKETGIC